MRNVLLVFVLLMGCGETEPDSGACEMVASLEGCPECADGEVTCTFDEISVTAFSCGGCQAEQGLWRELCDSGSMATAADITAGMVCEDTPNE